MRSKCCKKKEILMVLGAAGVGEGLARKLTEGDLDKKKNFSGVVRIRDGYE